jgi:uncharacterized protein YbjT (DUF2867 family)
MENILVTGATGNIGRQIVSQLLTRDFQVRAMARSPESAGLPREVDCRARGPHCSHYPRPMPGRCRRGVPDVARSGRGRRSRAGADCEARPADCLPLESDCARWRRRAGLSGQTLHAGIERLIEASSANWTFLRPGAFATNALMWWAQQVRAGDVVRWPYAGAVTSPIHERDIAAVAVRALCEDGHGGAKYILTGPQSLTQRDQVLIIGDAIGRPLRFEEVPPEVARRELMKMMPTSIADMFIDAWQNVEYAGSSTIGKPAPVTSTVAEITGVPARSFHDWAFDHAVEFQR